MKIKLSTTGTQCLNSFLLEGEGAQTLSLRTAERFKSYTSSHADIPIYTEPLTIYEWDIQHNILYLVSFDKRLYKWGYSKFKKVC